MFIERGMENLSGDELLQPGKLSVSLHSYLLGSLQQSGELVLVVLQILEPVLAIIKF